MALKIEKLVSGCIGMGHEDGSTVLVPGTLPGEVVEYRSVKERKGTREGELVGIVSPSPLRITPLCPLYGKCGGCDFLFVSPDVSAALKEEIVKDNLRRIGCIETLPPFLPPVYGSATGWRSRARIHVDIRTKKQGFLSRSSSSLVPVTHCPMLSPKLNTLLEEEGGALWRRARSLMFEGRTNRDTGLVEVPVFAGDEDVSLDDRSVRVTVDGIRYNVSSSVFFQSNPSLLPPLFSFVNENSIGESIMDLYSGVGTFSALFTGSGKTVYAVEREKKCLSLSRMNAPDALSFTDDCTLWARKSGRHVDTVIVDPPRVGLDRSVIPLIESWKPERIIYVSCNSVTLARDLKLFEEYLPMKAQVFDFYPGAGQHVETGVLLVRR